MCRVVFACRLVSACEVICVDRLFFHWSYEFSCSQVHQSIGVLLLSFLLGLFRRWLCVVRRESVRLGLLQLAVLVWLVVIRVVSGSCHGSCVCCGCVGRFPVGVA